MRAFVLSGGGNLGPLQIGAVRALFERGIVPDMVIGCSAGALNAVQIARQPDLGIIDALSDYWCQCRLSDVYPGSRLMAAARFIVGKDSLFDNRRFYAMLQRCGITPAHTFGNWAAIPLYITATDLRTGKLHVFGNDPNERILDAMMASTALTPFHPPWEVNGERYVDGGTVTPLPIRVALELGADEVYALHIFDSAKEIREPGLMRGVVGLVSRNVDTMLRLQAQHDLLLAQSAEVTLHYIQLAPGKSMQLTDFDHAAELAARGYETTREWLDITHVQPDETEPAGISPMRRITMALSSWLSPRGAFATAPVGKK